ncbi:MAG: hypothetical protein MIO92_16515 [Methanosarcinaceae archaeon]|nr:hypothetical protein [Methanosarcinaceae archaeon]
MRINCRTLELGIQVALIMLLTSAVTVTAQVFDNTRLHSAKILSFDVGSVTARGESVASAKDTAIIRKVIKVLDDSISFDELRIRGTDIFTTGERFTSEMRWTPANATVVLITGLERGPNKPTGAKYYYHDVTPVVWRKLAKAMRRRRVDLENLLDYGAKMGTTDLSGKQLD